MQIDLKMQKMPSDYTCSQLFFCTSVRSNKITASATADFFLRRNIDFFFDAIIDFSSRRYQFFLRCNNRFFFAVISIFSSRDIDFSSPRYRIFLRGDIDFFFARLRCLCPSWLRPLIASKEIKNYSLACDVNALVAATANSELENKKLFARLRCQRPRGCDR